MTGAEDVGYIRKTCLSAFSRESAKRPFLSFVTQHIDRLSESRPDGRQNNGQGRSCHIRSVPSRQQAPLAQKNR